MSDSKKVSLPYVFTEPHDETAPVLNLRELIRYCDEKKVEPNELSSEELKKFEVSPKQK